MKFKAMNEVKEDNKKRIWLSDKTPELRGVFRGEPHDFKIHWVDGKKKLCAGTGCEFCKMKIDSKFQFSLNFVHKGADGIMQAAIYENDWFTYKRLCKLNEEFPLEKHLVRIYKGEVDGYQNRDLFEKIRELEPSQLELIAGIHIIGLEDTSSPYTADPAFDADIPF